MGRSGADVLYQTFIPDVYSAASAAADKEDADEASVTVQPHFRKKPKKRADTDKGALYHAYDLKTHQFIAHIRRVHPLNKDIEMEVEKKGRVVVKAANPLAAPGVPLYYTHSKTNSYNNMFFMIWDNVMTPTFAKMCPWLRVDSKKALDRLLTLEFER